MFLFSFGMTRVDHLCLCVILQQICLMSASFLDMKIKTTYKNGYEKCKESGLALIKIQTQADLDSLNTWMKKNPSLELVWLGMRYNGEKFLWYDGTDIVVSNWDTVKDDEPDNLDKQKCSVVRKDLYWDSRECGISFDLVCQTVTDSPITTTTPKVTDIDQLPTIANKLVRKTVDYGVYLKDKSPSQQALLTDPQMNPIQCALACAELNQCTLFSTQAGVCKLFQQAIDSPIDMIENTGSLVWKKA